MKDVKLRVIINIYLLLNKGLEVAIFRLYLTHVKHRIIDVFYFQLTD